MNNILDEDSFTWDFDANVFKLLGSQLISDKFTAIIELVKNSYDANATEVKIDFIDAHDLEKGEIIIQDNGLGMTKDDIKKKWMKIGTNSKRNTYLSPKPFSRVLLGEKGIGRFAIEKIANKILLQSKNETSNQIHNLEIDWAIYQQETVNENPKLFTNIHNRYYMVEYSQSNFGKHGTALFFSNLKETWSSKDIERLKKELAKLISPIDSKFQNNKFKLLVKEKERDSLDLSEYEELRNDSLKYASTTYEIQYNKIADVQECLRFNEESNQVEIISMQQKTFGPIHMKLFYFNSSDKKYFNKVYRGKELKIDGFKIYRDGVLATPFVEKALNDDGVDKYRDILGIDKRRWSNFFGKISSHDFIAFIEISKQNNPGIRDLTNRQDFEDTLEYREFRNFIISQLHEIEKYLEKQKKEERAKRANNLEKALDELESIKTKINTVNKISPVVAKELSPALNIIKNVSTTIRDSVQEINELKKNLQHQEDVYFSLMSLQEYAADIAHMVKNSLDRIIGFSEYLYDKLKNTEYSSKMHLIYTESMKLNEDVNYMLNYAKAGDKLVNFNVALLLREIFNAYDHRFKQKNIKLEFERPDDFNIIHNKTLLRDVFNNLINNSLKALESLERQKIIKCTATKENSGYEILFSDNGIGILEENKRLIFDRYFTTTPKGSGLGLYIVKNNLKTFNGTIELINSEFKNVGTTFKIFIPIKEITND